MVAKYLELLLLSGRVEMATVGVAKVFSISHRVPMSAMLSFSSDIIIVLDREGRLIQTNRNFNDFFNITVDSAIGSLLSELRIQCLSCIWEEIFQGKVLPEDEISMETMHEVEGERKFLKAKVLLTVFEDGEKGVTLILEDITARKKAEIALKESEEKFRNVAELSSFPVAVIDSDGRYLYMNRKFTETFGYSEKEVREGRDWFRLAYPDPEYRKMAKEAWKEDLTQSRAGEVRPRIFTVTCRDGTEKEVCFRPVTMPDGNQLITYGDITEKRAIERQLQFLTSILDNSKKAIVGLDRYGKILTWNRGVMLMTGFTMDEMLGGELLSIFAPHIKASCEETLHTVCDGRSIENQHVIWIHKDGSFIDVSLNCSPILDRNRSANGILVIANDITKEKKAEKDLQIRDYVIAGMNTGIGLVDSDWGICYLNRAILDLLERGETAEIIGRSFAELINQDARAEKLLDAIQEAIRKVGIWEGEITLDLNRDAPLRCYMVARRVDDSEAGYIMINMEEMDRKKDAEKGIRIKGDEIEEIIEFLPEPTLMINDQGRVRRWNQAMERLTQIKKEEMIGKGDYAYALPLYGIKMPMLLDMVEKPDSEIIKYYPNFRRFGKELHAEVFMPCARGKGAYFWVKASPIYNENKTYVGAIESLMDITQWRAIRKVRMERSK
ncbi:MAG: PAS domain-containing protein [Methanomicrobiales archaeon]|nr:PAS domain-containing protein [Methanomicrobiales archaeon]